jgi:phospholipid-binding lipoprotein MlaA
MASVRRSCQASMPAIRSLCAPLTLCFLVFLGSQPAHATAKSADANAAEVAAGSSDEDLKAEFDAASEEQPVGFPDPLEKLNRETLALNQNLDYWIFNPITKVYQVLLPEPARLSVRRVLANLNSPSVMANDLLQREWKDAGVTVARFAVNTTCGLAGMFDPAKSWGLEPHSSDFGQTLALAGVPSGAYLVLPVLGPTTVRDGFGNLVDLLFRPMTYLLGPVDQLFYGSIQSGSAGLAARDEHSEELQMLEKSSIDFYATLRNAFYQNRTEEIWARRKDRRPPAVAPAAAPEGVHLAAGDL